MQTGRSYSAATASDLITFLHTRYDAGLAPQTLKLRHAALRYFYTVIGQAFPWLRDLPMSIVVPPMRERPSCPDASQTFELEHLQQIVRSLGSEPSAVRDKALFLSCFIGGARANELTRLEVPWIESLAEGLVLRLPWTRNDDQHRPREIILPSFRGDLCPVAALRVWLHVSGIKHGPVFRRIRRLPPKRGKQTPEDLTRYRICDGAVTPDAISFIIRARAAAAGLALPEVTARAVRNGAIRAAGLTGGLHALRQFADASSLAGLDGRLRGTLADQLKRFGGYAALAGLDEYVGERDAMPARFFYHRYLFDGAYENRGTSAKTRDDVFGPFRDGPLPGADKATTDIRLTVGVGKSARGLAGVRGSEATIRGTRRDSSLAISISLQSRDD
jgi:integrase